MQRIDILWRDIPSQVLIKRGRDRGKYMLSAQLGQEIEAQYSDDDITRLAKQNGYSEPSS
jgi:tRNA A37 N6-isopentenylltransferase MiaA